MWSGDNFHKKPGLLFWKLPTPLLHASRREHVHCTTPYCTSKRPTDNIENLGRKLFSKILQACCFSPLPSGFSMFLLQKSLPQVWCHPARLVKGVEVCHNWLPLSNDCTTGLFQNAWLAHLPGDCFPQCPGHLSGVPVWDKSLFSISWFPSSPSKHVIEPLRPVRLHRKLNALCQVFFKLMIVLCSGNIPIRNQLQSNIWNPRFASSAGNFWQAFTSNFLIANSHVSTHLIGGEVVCM